MNNRSIPIILLIALAAVSSVTAAIAQSEPLSGSVQMSVDPTMRIRRSSMRQSTGVDASDFRSKLIPQQAQLAPLVDSKLFEGAAKQSQEAAPVLNSGIMQQVASQIQAALPMFNSSAAKNEAPEKLAPYIWYQSAMGGYFDGSRTTTELVRADRLYLFGGKFEDGTLVPKTQIHDFNAMGHAFKQATLNTDHFWSH